MHRSRHPPPALADARPDAFTPDLARSLNNRRSGWPIWAGAEEALAAITEAVTLHRELAAARPARSPPTWPGR